MKTSKPNLKPVMALLAWATLLIALSAVSSAATPGEEDATRVTVTKHFHGDGRDKAALIRESRDEHAPSQSGRRSERMQSAAVSKAGARAAMSAGTDFWFYTVDVELYADEDRDGYYSGVDLLFDVDTYHSIAEIYAVAYLSFEGGPWEEYAVTEDFTIFGSSGDDDYVIVTDLVSGYPTGDYDVLIEVFDAGNGDFLAFFGPEDTSELAFLPLEDMDRDAPSVGDTRITLNSGGGGSVGWLLLFVLLLAAVVRRLATNQAVGSSNLSGRAN